MSIEAFSGVDVAKIAALFSEIIGTQLYYEIDKAVGPNCPNDRHDLLLIQYMLKHAVKDPELSGPGPRPELTVDGRPGLQTFAAIKWFQEAAPMVTARDGRIDPVVGNKTVTAAGRAYTILQLNGSFLKVKPADYRRMWAAADFPRELGAAVRAEFIFTGDAIIR